MSRFGDLPDRTHRRLPPGVPKEPSPYFPPAKKADIPDGFKWVRDFKDEASDELLLKITDILFRIRHPFYQFPPFYHTIIDMLANVQVNAGATETVLTLTIPQKEMARIRFYGQDITPVPPAVLPGTQWAEVTWQFRVNGAPLRDYNHFLGQRGAVIWPAETTVILDGADVFDIIVTNNSAVNNYFAWASIRGWQWSQDMIHIEKEDSI